MRTAVVCEAFSSGRLGAEQSLGSVAVTACGCTSCPSSLRTQVLVSGLAWVCDCAKHYCVLSLQTSEWLMEVMIH